jgi:hypothetical protein
MGFGEHLKVLVLKQPGLSFIMYLLKFHNHDNSKAKIQKSFTHAPSFP